MILEILIFLLTFLIFYIFYSHKRTHAFFNERGVKYLPGVPFFGNAFGSTILKNHMLDDIDQVYKAFPEEKYVGYMEVMERAILVRDPDLIKTLTVKDFDHFVDHKKFFPEEMSPLFANSLIMMEGKKWRDMRTTLSPAFTGSKMKHMMPFMTEVAHNIVNYLKEHEKEDVNLNDLINRYTTDVIASAGFGLQVNSLVDKDNEFYRYGQDMFELNPVQRVLMVLAIMFPGVSAKLGMKPFKAKVTKFFEDIVSKTIEYREKNNVERPDMIQLLMQATKGTLKDTGAAEKDIGFAAHEEVRLDGSTRDWTALDITSQVFLFFVAGFETSATAITMTLHELALSPDVQEKLYQELIAFKETHQTLTYDNISDLKYLDCVINETLRKWSSAIFMDRVCTKAYELPPPREGGKPYLVKPGELVYSVVNSLHLDPKYYPEPEKYNPDRFSDENKHNIKPFTFMPFGAGPRICIGSRFAIMEIKVFLYHVLLNFKVLKTEKTPDPIVLKTKDFTLKAKGNSWVKFELRN